MFHYLNVGKTKNIFVQFIDYFIDFSFIKIVIRHKGNFFRDVAPKTFLNNKDKF